MKNYLKTGVGIATVLFLSIALLASSCATPAPPAPPAESKSEPVPKVTIDPPVLEIIKTAKVVIMGSSFEPGQEVRILFTTYGERAGTANVDIYLDPEPVADDTGAWITVFDVGRRYINKKMVTEGVYSITVTDSEYNTLATAPVAFYDAGKPGDEWPGWALVFGTPEK